MKKGFFIIILSLFFIVLNAQNTEKIILNKPDTTRGLNLMIALSRRHSEKKFKDKELSLQDLSDLMWAANGINRPKNKKRTAPSALNAQDIDIYVFMRKGIYLYNAFDHVLELQVKGDHRNLLAGMQKWVKKAPVVCLLVSDISRFKLGKQEQRLVWAACDAGIVSQNISVFCASVGLSNHPRCSMSINKIKTLLNLSEKQYPILNNPVGYFE